MAFEQTVSFPVSALQKRENVDFMISPDRAFEFDVGGRGEDSIDAIMTYGGMSKYHRIRDLHLVKQQMMLAEKGNIRSIATCSRAEEPRGQAPNF